jgi:hypothetical protein
VATCESIVFQYAFSRRVEDDAKKTLPLISGNALTDFFLQDVGITQNQFNVGQQLMSLGIVLLEVSFQNRPESSANVDVWIDPQQPYSVQGWSDFMDWLTNSGMVRLFFC